MKVTRMDAYTRQENKGKVMPGAALVKTPPLNAPAGIFKTGIGKIFSELKTDDYILIAIIAVLFFEGCDDYILLAALGYLFIMGFKQ